MHVNPSEYLDSPPCLDRERVWPRQLGLRAQADQILGAQAAAKPSEPF